MESHYRINNNKYYLVDNIFGKALLCTKGTRQKEKY